MDTTEVKELRPVHGAPSMRPVPASLVPGAGPAPRPHHGDRGLGTQPLQHLRGHAAGIDALRAARRVRIQRRQRPRHPVRQHQIFIHALSLFTA